MRGMGRKGGSSYRGSFDQLRHMDSPTDQRSQAVRGEHYDSLHSIARDTPAPVTSAPNVLRRPFQSSVVNANVGSSSSSASTPCASGGITPNGEPTMHARDTTTSSSDCLPLALDESRRPRIKLVNGMLHPSDVCARKITFIFKERMDENGYSWKNVSKETKDFYWNEFQKFFVWDESMSSAIKMAWQRKAAERYRALMCNLRKGKEKSIHVSDSAWKTWTEAWNSPEYKTKCEKATANRLTEIAGPGSGISRHTGGSISHSSHADRLRSRLGRDPRPFELFEVTHTKKGTSMLVDARAQSIKDRYLELVEQASQTQEGHDELPIMDETALYYEAVGGGKKNRVYGIGSQACSYYPQLSSSFSTGSSSETLQAEVRDLRQALTQVQDREERLQQTLSQVQDREERLQQSLLEMKEERDQYREEMMRQMKDMMMSFEKRILQQSQFTTQDSQPLTDHDVDL